LKKTSEKTKQSLIKNKMGSLSNLLALLIWPALVSLPLFLTHNENFKSLFPTEWYVSVSVPNPSNNGQWPSPLGLSLGIAAVVIGQVVVLFYFTMWNAGWFGELYPIEKKGPPKYDYWTSMLHHLKQPEGFVLLGGYLIFTWMFGLMPSSYYSFSGGINWVQVVEQLLIADFLEYVSHRLEHSVSPSIYQYIHKPHHKFTNPKLFDAFDGSLLDTLCMVVVPLFITTRLVNANVWTYMTFGTLHANWLCLIHSEYRHVWDRLFREFGLGTAADHHVHHFVFTKNYGHLFM
jgi:sterol desaturase/sphingolipid hydroxylase (fatty acid hydroxylase superfamily)